MEPVQCSSQPRAVKSLRRIQFMDPAHPAKLAIKPPGLMWKGKPAICTEQPLHQRDMMMSRSRPTQGPDYI